MNPIITLYVKYIEKILTTVKNNQKKEEVWNKIKNNTKILEYASNIIDNNFTSEIIVYNILNDKELNNTTIKNNIINHIFKNKILARKKIYPINDSYLIYILKNNLIKLDKDKRLFIIEEAKNSLEQKKYYDNNKNIISYHGIGLYDIRFLILLNKHFTLQEKKELFDYFYPDEDYKIYILNELENIISEKLYIDLEYENNLDALYSSNAIDLKNKYNYIKDIDDILELIKLCKYIKKYIPEETIKEYKKY